MLVAAAVLNLVSRTCLAPRQATAGGPTSQELKSLIDQQADQIRQLQQRLDAQDAIYHPPSRPPRCPCDRPVPITRLPIVVEEPQKSCWKSTPGPAYRVVDYETDYDRGFVLRPFHPNKSPFELKINGWIQFRHHAFASSVESWTDNAGVVRPVRDRNTFDIERARLVFSGFAVDERLTYFLQLDGDTDGRHTVDFFDYWWAWECSKQLKLQLGKRKVPAGRQWLLGARLTRFVDRPVANDFFRPDRTIGLFAQGKISDVGHYEAMVGNGYQTTNLPASVTDSLLTFAATNYWDPFGDYGEQICDYEHTATPLTRLGGSFVYSPQAADPFGVPLDEADFVRLTDGTRLTQVGALAPGVRISDFDIYFFGLDAALKYRGWSVNAEAFFRWIQELRGNGPLPTSKLFQRGFYVEGGTFLIAKRLDFNLRYSRVMGLYGNASEYAAGCNWYPLDTPRLKLSFDVTRLDGSPLQNTASDILDGDRGVLFRTQFQAEF